MKISMMGTGYVGLSTGVGFAVKGNDVICVDIDERKVGQINKGISPIFEPHLEGYLKDSLSKGKLRATTNTKEAIEATDISFIAVGTPSRKDGSIDLSYIESVSRQIGEVLKNKKSYHVVVVKSTVVPGTTEGIILHNIERASGKKAGKDFGLCMNPEFLREGRAMEDFLKPDRVVIGSIDSRAGNLIEKLYVNFMAPILRTDLKTAEMIKYASNAFLATKISYTNEMGNICKKLGIDVNEVMKGVGMDHRISPHFLSAGVGYGGSCFEGHETVFVLNSPNVATESFETLFAHSGEPSQGATVQVATPTDRRVLAFDLETGQPTLAEVKAVTRRPYTGMLVHLKTSMGRSLAITADHPVVLRGANGFEIVPAIAVSPGDQLMALCDLPTVEAPVALNLIDLLRDTPLEADVYVSPVDDSFTEQYAQFVAHIPPDMLRYPHEIKQNNRMSLRLFRHLNEAGVLHVPAEKLQLYTAKGSATKINAVLPVDSDLMRACGYYLAEGYIGCDTGRAGAVRERVGFTFNEAEAEYISDLQIILSRWGLKFIERHGTRATTTVVSSRIFAWLLRDVLKCGTRSDNKALPRMVFNVSPDLRHNLLRGAFSGDGAVTPVQDGKNLMLEYATVSKLLSDGMALLLQSLGVVPSIRTRWMNKSKQPAYILRVSGFAQLEALRDIFGDKHRAQIETILAGYQRQIRQRGFSKQGTYAALTVHAVEYEDVNTTVYSLETTTGTLIASSGLICHNCFPKDMEALIAQAKELGYEPKLLEEVHELNNRQKVKIVEQLERRMANLKGKTVCLLGLAFKPNSDDIREASSIYIISKLLEKGANVKAYDPQAIGHMRKLYPDVEYAASAKDAIENSDACLIVTEWDEFKRLTDEDFAKMKGTTIIEGRRILDRAKVSKFEGICW